MRQFRNRIFWFLLAGGVFLLSKGGFSVYPLVWPPAEEVEETVLSEDTLASTIRTGSISYLANGNSSAASAVPDRQPKPQFEEGAFVARLEIPRLHTIIHVVEGADGAALRLGAGHLSGTPLPGLSGNSVIAGHRDTHFRVLKDVQVGERLLIERGAQRVSYTIVETSIVDPQDISVLHSSDGRMLTLITCYPFSYIGPAPQRFIVKAIAD